jgi:hypothetical protein
VYKSYTETRTAKKQWCFDHFINHRSMKKVIEVRNQLVEYFAQMAEVEKTPDNERLAREWASFSIPERVLRCIVAAFFTQVAVRQPTGRYTTLKDNKVHTSTRPRERERDRERERERDREREREY